MDYKPTNLRPKVWGTHQLWVDVLTNHPMILTGTNRGGRVSLEAKVVGVLEMSTIRPTGTIAGWWFEPF